MNQNPKLTEADVRALATGQSYERGYSYYQRGYVNTISRRGDRLIAEVEGSGYEPYQVQVTLAESGIAGAECTCPYDWGGYCKHIVAMLLTYIHEGDQVEEKPELAALLAELTAEQLQQIIINLAADQPGLEDRIEEEIGRLEAEPVAAANVPATAARIPVDIASARRELRKEMRRLDQQGGGRYYGDYYDDESDPAEPLAPHLQKARELLDANAIDAAVALLTAVVEEWTEGVEDLDDWYYEYNEDPIREATLDIDQLLAEALLSLDLSPAERDEWLGTVGDWSDSPAGKLKITETALEDGWDYPPLVQVLQGRITEKGAWEHKAPFFADELANARLNVLARQGRRQEFLHLAEAEGQLERYVYMLAEMGRADEAVKEARAYFRRQDSVLKLAGLLHDAGATAAAIDIADYGLSLEEHYQKAALARWLRDTAQAAGRGEIALKAAKAAFLAHPTLADYQAVEAISGDTWPQLRQELLVGLEKAPTTPGKIDVLLQEKRLEAAMRAVENTHYYTSDLARVIEATKEQYPDWGIRRYQRLAEAIMDAGKANRYSEAAGYLQKARDIYLLHGRQAEWRAYLEGVLAEHGRKYKLVPLLRAL
jgi:uncharacterized Zn finger protein